MEKTRVIKTLLRISVILNLAYLIFETLIIVFQSILIKPSYLHAYDLMQKNVWVFPSIPFLTDIVSFIILIIMIFFLLKHIKAKGITIGFELFCIIFFSIKSYIFIIFNPFRYYFYASLGVGFMERYSNMTGLFSMFSPLLTASMTLLFVACGMSIFHKKYAMNSDTAGEVACDTTPYYVSKQESDSIMDNEPKECSDTGITEHEENE